MRAMGFYPIASSAKQNKTKKIASPKSGSICKSRGIPVLFLPNHHLVWDSLEADVTVFQQLELPTN